jgi:hypothetical protein
VRELVKVRIVFECATLGQAFRHLVRLGAAFDAVAERAPAVISVSRKNATLPVAKIALHRIGCSVLKTGNSALDDRLVV